MEVLLVLGLGLPEGAGLADLGHDLAGPDARQGEDGGFGVLAQHGPSSEVALSIPLGRPACPVKAQLPMRTSHAASVTAQFPDAPDCPRSDAPTVKSGLRGVVR